MDSAYNIFIERLRDGHIEKIEETLTPEFIGIHEKFLFFQDPVYIKGEAYLAEDTLVVHLEINTKSTIPCSVCNEPVKTDISIHNFYHAEPLENIKSGIFNYQEILRECVLLETSSFAECEQGNCPRRLELQKYFKKPGSNSLEDEEGYQPFANLSIDD